MINQPNYDETRDMELDEIRNQGLKENNALRVYTYLKANERARNRRLPRWIWELLQNAHDASIAHEEPLIVNIKYSPGELVFSHNGSSFEAKQIFNLIYHGSTKTDEKEAIGEYGSGFLTTHLLSPEIKVSGLLDDKQDNRQWFDFCLTRKSDSPDELLDLMDEAWKNFKKSLPPQELSISDPAQELSIPDPFTTQFVYPIIGADAEKAVEEGIKTLKQCASYVVVFNSKFSRIDISDHGEALRFEAIERDLTDTPEIQQVTVAAYKNGNIKKNKYFLALSSDKKTSVTAPLELNSNGSVCQSVENMPRLFKAFPLVGTEFFSFPIVINSFKFTPTEDRNGVQLGLNDTDPENIENQTIIEEACTLLVHLLQFAASKGWHHVYQWAEVPAIQGKDWLNTEWLRTRIKGNLIEEIRKTPIVLNADDNPIDPKKVRLLLSESEASIQTFWDLCDGIKGQRKFLPKREEVVGWCNAIKSWADVYQDEPVSLFSEVRDGPKLASYIERFTHKDGEYGSIEDLQKLLQEDISAVEWLNRLHNFFNENGLREAVSKYYIVIDQLGYLDKLSALHRDPGIHKELKDIAELLDWQLRQELRDIRLTSLTEEEGCGDIAQDDVVNELCQKLRARADEKPGDNFKIASTQLFAWIVDEEEWDRLRGFPAFAETADSDELSVIRLPHPTQDNSQDDERPLAPVLSWENDLQDYSELFPGRYILASTFFDAVPDSDIWQTLEEKGFARKDVIIRHRRKVPFETFLPHDPLTEEDTHETREKITVSNIAFLGTKDVGIIDRVRKSPPLARKFWHFLTEWLIVHNSEAVKIIDKVCVCGEIHRCYPAEWLVPVVNRKWVPLGENKADKATAETLANLLRDSHWNLSSLSEDHPVAKLLEAISVARFDLLRQTVAENDDTRVAVDNALIKMFAKTDGNIDNLDHAIDYIEALRDDEDLPNVIAERRERKRIVRENKDLGQQVENLVKENLEQKNFEGKGFTVERTGKGSDFEMEDTEGITTLNVVQEDRKWLIEVKATRTEGDNQRVRMTSTQAQTAVKEKDKFLLCVVPLGQEDVTSETVRENMRFIQNIGDSIAPLWEGLKSLKKKPVDIDIILDVEEGKAGILVKKSVWENDGFPLEKLTDHLNAEHLK